MSLEASTTSLTYYLGETPYAEFRCRVSSAPSSCRVVYSVFVGYRRREIIGVNPLLFHVREYFLLDSEYILRLELRRATTFRVCFRLISPCGTALSREYAPAVKAVRLSRDHLSLTRHVTSLQTRNELLSELLETADDDLVDLCDFLDAYFK